MHAKWDTFGCGVFTKLIILANHPLLYNVFDIKPLIIINRFFSGKTPPHFQIILENLKWIQMKVLVHKFVVYNVCP